MSRWVRSDLRCRSRAENIPMSLSDSMECPNLTQARPAFFSKTTRISVKKWED